MKLRVLGSGSSGNCYLLENENECLVLEAGLSLKEVKIALNFNISKITAVLVTHGHKDHCGFSNQFKRAGIRVFEPYNGTNKKQMVFGNFIVTWFPLVHDTENYGYLIWHPDIGWFLYATDTEYIRYTFKKTRIRTMLVEANYSKDLINRDEERAGRVFLSHMDIDTTVEFIKNSMTEYLKTVVLCHMSRENASSDDFKSKVEEIFAGDVKTARKGLEVIL